jgi:polyisoprenoid-binding protein YceI
MKRVQLTAILAACGILALMVMSVARVLGADAPPASQPTQFVSAADPGQAQVSGTSTLHNWTAKTVALTGNATVVGPISAGVVQSLHLAISANSLHSSEGSGMDNVMYDALKVKQAPNITYDLISAKLRSAPTAQDPEYHFDAVGSLSVAGKTQQITLDLAAQAQSDGTLVVNTQANLKMSDYGISPPTAMLGMIKSGDAVTVSASWRLMAKPK